MNDHPKALMDIIDAEVDCTGPRKETEEIMEPRRAMGLARKCRVIGYHGITVSLGETTSIMVSCRNVTSHLQIKLEES